MVNTEVNDFTEDKNLVNSKKGEFSPNLIFNFLGLNMLTNLGVAKHASALITMLSRDYPIIVMVDDSELASESEIGKTLLIHSKIFVTLSEAKDLIKKNPGEYLEILIHHFKLATLGIKAVVLCHDLHVFDVPWKYKDIKASQSNFEKASLSLMQLSVISRAPITELNSNWGDHFVISFSCLALVS